MQFVLHFVVLQQPVWQATISVSERAMHPLHVASMVAALVACASVRQATLVHTAHEQQTVLAFLLPRMAISAAAVVMECLRTGSPVHCRASQATPLSVPSHPVHLAFFLLFQCARLMWIV